MPYDYRAKATQYVRNYMGWPDAEVVGITCLNYENSEYIVGIDPCAPEGVPGAERFAIVYVGDEVDDDFVPYSEYERIRKAVISGRCG